MVGDGKGKEKWLQGGEGTKVEVKVVAELAAVADIDVLFDLVRCANGVGGSIANGE